MLTQFLRNYEQAESRLVIPAMAKVHAQQWCEFLNLDIFGETVFQVPMIKIMIIIMILW